MPPSITKQCVTKEDVADPQKAVPQGRGTPNNCKMSDYKSEGNKVTFAMKCAEPPTTMSTEIVYGENSYNGTMKTEMSRGGQPMVMTMTFTGTRLGDCTK
jgi:hypothetical protein